MQAERLRERVSSEEGKNQKQQQQKMPNNKEICDVSIKLTTGKLLYTLSFTVAGGRGLNIVKTMYITWSCFTAATAAENGLVFSLARFFSLSFFVRHFFFILAIHELSIRLEFRLFNNSF